MKPAIHEVLRKTPEGRRLLREEELAKVRACRDIVRDWDDPDDFSLWREVFASSRSSASAAATPTSARKRSPRSQRHCRNYEQSTFKLIPSFDGINQVAPPDDVAAVDHELGAASRRPIERAVRSASVPSQFGASTVRRPVFMRQADGARHPLVPTLAASPGRLMISCAVGSSP